MITGPVWLMQPIPYFGEKLRGEWTYEPKIDGWRMQVIRRDNGGLECWGRRLEKLPNWTADLSYMLEKAKNIPHGTLLDTELCSTRGRRFIPSLFARNPKAKPVVHVFDIVYLEGEFIGNMPLYKRRKLLQKLNFQKPFNLLYPGVLTCMKKNFLSMVKEGIEGIVIKKIDSPYEVGRDGPIATQHWRKIK